MEDVIFEVMHQKNVAELNKAVSFFLAVKHLTEFCIDDHQVSIKISYPPDMPEHLKSSYEDVVKPYVKEIVYWVARYLFGVKPGIWTGRTTVYQALPTPSKQLKLLYVTAYHPHEDARLTLLSLLDKFKILAPELTNLPPLPPVEALRVFRERLKTTKIPCPCCGELMRLKANTSFCRGCKDKLHGLRKHAKEIVANSPDIEFDDFKSKMSAQKTKSDGNYIKFRKRSPWEPYDWNKLCLILFHETVKNYQAKILDDFFNH